MLADVGQTYRLQKHSRHVVHNLASAHPALSCNKLQLRAVGWVQCIIIVGTDSPSRDKDTPSCDKPTPAACTPMRPLTWRSAALPNVATATYRKGHQALFKAPSGSTRNTHAAASGLVGQCARTECELSPPARHVAMTWCTKSSSPQTPLHTPCVHNDCAPKEVYILNGGCLATTLHLLTASSAAVVWSAHQTYVGACAHSCEQCGAGMAV